jgi:hypothetical protein
MIINLASEMCITTRTHTLKVDLKISTYYSEYVEKINTKCSARVGKYSE